MTITPEDIGITLVGVFLVVWGSIRGQAEDVATGIALLGVKGITKARAGGS